MATTGVTNNREDFYMPKTAATIKQNKELGMNEFMKLFITQLQHQDPTAPQDESAMMNQMVQMSTVQAMEAMANASLQSQAYGMIGKGIVGIYRDENNYPIEILGTVDGAGTEDGKLFLMVGEHKVFMEDVAQVFDNSVFSGDANSMLAGTVMVGKYAQATYNVGGQEYTETGKVQGISFQDGKLLIRINGQDFLLAQITAVADDPESLIPPVTEEETEEIPPVDGGEDIPPADGGEDIPPVDGDEVLPPADSDEDIPPVDNGEEDTPAIV